MPVLPAPQRQEPPPTQHVSDDGDEPPPAPLVTIDDESYRLLYEVGCRIVGVDPEARPAPNVLDLSTFKPSSQLTVQMDRVEAAVAALNGHDGSFSKDRMLCFTSEGLESQPLEEKTKATYKQQQRTPSSLQSAGPHSPAITSKSQRLVRAGKVEDSLLQRKGQYNAKLECLRRSREQEELQEIHPPEITPASKGLHRPGSAHERLYADARRPKAKVEQLRAALAAEEEAEVGTGQPAINPFSKSLVRSTDHLLEWEHMKKEKIRQRQMQSKQAELNEVSGTPQLNRTSVKIASGHRRGRQSVESGLLQWKEQVQQRRDRAAAVTVGQDSPFATPKRCATPSRQCTPRKKEDWSRLCPPPNTDRPSTPSSKMVDPETGQPLFKPKINKGPGTPTRSGQPVWDHLLEEGQRQNMRRQKAIEEEMLRKEEGAHVPVLGAYTELLAQISQGRGES
eukprot:Sspe_Gene.69999::Locus_41331_Transcript_1_1_Confidence_1.000_Length_1404::g.69999::m.69999